MNVVDSSGWLEYLADGPNADVFAPPVEDIENLLVPSISILEVFEWVLRERGEREAIEAVALMQLGRVVELDTAIAIDAARIGIDHGLPLADSVILATARTFRAELWTQDADFAGITGVRYTEKRK